mmetsp:Transcript_37007/g.105769  ORF Transcript_37007/g.105769 Transcript_37007/m.105769 type:complete len:274 (-) Transcript_37007:87-908(-)
MCPGVWDDTSFRSCSKRGPIPRPESVNSRPFSAHSFTGFGRLRQDCLEGPYQVEAVDMTECSPSPAIRRWSSAGPPKRRLCASTARAADVQVSLISAAPALLVLPLLPPPPSRLGADLDSARFDQREPPACSAPRRCPRCVRCLIGDRTLTLGPSFTTACTTLGAGFGASGGGRGVSCRGSSPVQSRPCRRLRPTSRIARDFSVLFNACLPFVLAADAAAAAANLGAGRAPVSSADSSASRSGKRTGSGGSRQSEGPGPGSDLQSGSYPSPGS